MDREIKFRAFTRKFGMVGPEDSKRTIDVHSHTVWHDARCDECAELMQFTGLKDRNGTEIYEGDIIEVFGAESGLMRIMVEDIALMDLSTLYPAGLVLGNIYENPELLKE